MSVFVSCYGSLRTGGSNHRVMNNAGGTSVGQGKLSYDALMVSLGGFPAVSLQAPTEGIRPVVEVFSVREDNLVVLDRLEGYYGEGNRNNLYDRQTVSVVMDSGEEIKCLMYVLEGRDLSDYARVRSGDWLEYDKDKEKDR